MALWVVTQRFEHYGTTYEVGDVVDDVADPNGVAQLITDRAPITLATVDALEAADTALYLKTDFIPGYVPYLVTTEVVAATDRIEIGGEWPPPEWAASIVAAPRDPPKLFITFAGAPAAQNLVEMRGTTAGQFAIMIADGCSIISNGQISANDRWSPINGVNPTIDGRPYGVGASSDWNQTAQKTSAMFLAESNHADLDFLQGFKLGDSHWRFRLLDTGGMWFGVGNTITPFFKITPVGNTGLQFGGAATERIGLYGETPVVQAVKITDADGTLGSATSRINLLIDALEGIGISAKV